MKPTPIALLALCLPLVGAEKKTDVEKEGYKGRVKSVERSQWDIVEKFGKSIKTLPKSLGNQLKPLPTPRGIN